MWKRACLGLMLTVTAGVGACSGDDGSSSASTTTTAGSGGMTAGSGGSAAMCGDGVVEGIEECEPGGSEVCTDDCQLASQPGWRVNLPNMQLRAVTVDAEGRVYAAGNSIDGNNENPTVMQFEADGTPGWTYSIDTDSTDEEFVAAIAPHPSGDVVLAGIRHAHEFAFSEEAYVARLDVATGDPVWVRRISKMLSDSEAVGPRMAVDTAGNIVVAVAEDGNGFDADAVFTEWDADGNRIRANRRSDIIARFVAVAAGAAGDFEVVVSLASPMDPNNADRYRVRPDAQGDFTQDTLVTGALSDLAIGPGGDRWRLGNELRRTDLAGSDVWSLSLTGFISLDLALRPDGSSYALGMASASSTEVRAVSGTGEIVWQGPTTAPARAVAAGGRTLAVVGNDLDADTAFIETTRIPAVP